MSAVVGQRFPRLMRLKRRRLIAPLFDPSSSRSVTAGSVRILYRFVSRTETGTALQVGFAPGRCRNAVQRNHIRRQMRETWRTHQDLIKIHAFPESRALTLMIVSRKYDRHVKTLSRDILQAMQLLHQTTKMEISAWTGIQ